MINQKSNSNTLLEVILLILILLSYLIINLLTASLSPTVWIDEVMFADPAINLLLGKGFTSTAWSVQSSNELFAGNAPLYSLLLYPWISAFGISPESVRSLNYLLMILVAVIWWRIVSKLDLIKSLNTRLFFVITLLTGYGITFSYRSGRYDILGILLLSCFLWVAVEYRKNIYRNFFLIAIAFLFPLTGLQLIAYVLISGIFLILFLDKRKLPEFGMAILGIFLGALCLSIFYLVNGVWDKFIGSVFLLSEVEMSFLEKMLFSIRQLPEALRVDYSSLILLILLTSIAIFKVLIKDFRFRSSYSLGLLFALWTILGMLVSGRYVVYYSWMIFIPLCVSIFVELEVLRAKHKNKFLIQFIVLLISLACLIGLPLRVMAIVSEYSLRDYTPVQEFVTSHLRKEDVVFSDYQAYYPAKLKAKQVFLPTYLSIMTEKEIESVSVLVIQPHFFEEIKKQVKENWIAEEKITTSKNTKKQLNLPRIGRTVPYSLQVFRRGSKN